jgi:hypothetical protein
LYQQGSGDGSTEKLKALNPKKTLGYEKDLYPHTADSGNPSGNRCNGCHRSCIDPVLRRET